jgi:hypothetical protein
MEEISDEAKGSQAGRLRLRRGALNKFCHVLFDVQLVGQTTNIDGFSGTFLADGQRQGFATSAQTIIKNIDSSPVFPKLVGSLNC